jgi:hypothetical protein
VLLRSVPQPGWHLPHRAPHVSMGFGRVLRFMLSSPRSALPSQDSLPPPLSSPTHLVAHVALERRLRQQMQRLLVQVLELTLRQHHTTKQLTHHLHTVGGGARGEPLRFPSARRRQCHTACRVRLGLGDELTPPFRHARPIPLTQVYPVPRTPRTTRTCGRCSSFKGTFTVPHQTLFVRFATFTSLMEIRTSIACAACRLPLSEHNDRMETQLRRFAGRFSWITTVHAASLSAVVPDRRTVLDTPPAPSQPLRRQVEGGWMGFRVGDELTPPFRDARPIPLTRL